MIAQVVAIAIFVIMFVLIILDIFERHVVTLICGLATLVLVFGVCMHSFDAAWETLNFSEILTKNFWIAGAESSESTSGINWATIIFIVGMMIMVEGMAICGFFRWLCMSIAKLVNYKIIPIFITFMIMSAILAMFIDSITVILFLAAVTVELAKLLKFNPIPMILSEIFCANLGGSATMSGDPPNIIIGTSLHYSFFDFINNTGLIAGISLVFIIIYFYFCFRKTLKKSEEKAMKNRGNTEYPSPREAITSMRGFVLSTIIFIAAIIMLVTHAETGLSVAAIGVIIAVATLIVAGKSIPKVCKQLDYKTVLFFIGLFIVVGGLEQTKVLEIIADFIGKISGGNVIIMIPIIIWVSGIASAFVDNIPFAATMIPVIKSLAATSGVDLSVLAWALSMGTDVGGSATPIGASANVVGTSVAAKEGYPIGWKEYCKSAVPATVIVLVISMVTLWVRYC